MTDAKDVSNALGWLVAERNRRLELLKKLGVQTIDQYNELIVQQALSGNQQSASLPHILVVIDEIDDYALDGDEKIEELVVDIANNITLTGVHLVISTQIPTEDNVSSLLSGVSLCRVVCKTINASDSKILTGQSGPKNFLGKGTCSYIFQVENCGVRNAALFLREK